MAALALRACADRPLSGLLLVVAVWGKWEGAAETDGASKPRSNFGLRAFGAFLRAGATSLAEMTEELDLMDAVEGLRCR